jgi:3-dehydroquinate synthase
MIMSYPANRFAVQSHRGEYVVRRERLASVLPSGLLPDDRLIVDQTVLKLHPFVTALAASENTYAVIADESLKSLDGIRPILSWLLDSEFQRDGTLYVVGGGTVQDASGFAASIFHRGARWVFAPTTLLSQGDSCIGSKSSINYGGYKNQLGTFYPPAEIVIDDAFLETLSPVEIRAGLGEMLHYAALGDEEVFVAYETAIAFGLDQLRARDLTALAMLALDVKREFIEADEFDSDVRRNLNLGHTFGHGLEFASGGQIPHGIAVAYGVDLASAYAEGLGILNPITRARIGRIVRALVDGGELGLVGAARLFDGMSKDKKRSSGQIELILIEDVGKPVRTVVPLDEHLMRFLETYLAIWRAKPSRARESGVV